MAETAPAQMAMAGYGGWQIGDGSRDIYQGEYKQGAKKLFWGTLDTAFVGTSQWTRAGKLGTIATDTTTAYRAVDTNWNSIAYTKAKYDNFRAGKNAVFGAAEYANTGKLASAEYLGNSKQVAGALRTADNVANDVAKIERTETISNDAIKANKKVEPPNFHVGSEINGISGFAEYVSKEKNVYKAINLRNEATNALRLEINKFPSTSQAEKTATMIGAFDIEKGLIAIGKNNRRITAERLDPRTVKILEDRLGNILNYVLI